jgi:hypothetical protein
MVHLPSAVCFGTIALDIGTRHGRVYDRRQVALDKNGCAFEQSQLRRKRESVAHEDLWNHHMKYLEVHVGSLILDLVSKS